MYCQVSNLLLGTITTEHNIAKTDSYIDRLGKPLNMSHRKLANGLWMKQLRSLQVEVEYDCKAIVVEGLRQHSYRNSHKPSPWRIWRIIIRH